MTVVRALIWIVTAFFVVMMFYPLLMRMLTSSRSRPRPTCPISASSPRGGAGAVLYSAARAPGTTHP